jgi:O-antigen ligase
MSVFVSESIEVSASKFVPLVALVVVCSVASNRIVETYGSQSARRVVISWLILLAPVYLFNFLSRLTGGFFNTGASWAVGSFRGIAGNSNTLGAFLAFTLPFLLSIVVWERHRLTPKLQALTLAALGLIGLLYLTRSRASALAFLVAAATIQVIHTRSRMSHLAVMCGGLALCYAAYNPSAVTSVYEDWLFKGKTKGGLLSSRVAQWEDSYDLFETHPWLGYGFGVTSVEEGEWNLEHARSQKVERGSSVLAVLSQVGVVGGLPLYLGIVLVLIRGFHFAFRVKDAYFTAILASCMGAFANSFFEGWIVSPGNGLLWLFLSQIYLMDSVMNRYRPPKFKPARGPRGRTRLQAPPRSTAPIVGAAP